MMYQSIIELSNEKHNIQQESISSFDISINRFDYLSTSSSDKAANRSSDLLKLKVISFL